MSSDPLVSQLRGVGRDKTSFSEQDNEAQSAELP